jgi:hypothetical protein
MTKLYGNNGFIDMAPEPEFSIDDERLLINVVFKVDEGKQYHVGTVEILGLKPQAERALKSQLGTRQVFDGSSFMNFFQEYNGGLPTDVSLDDAIQLRRDEPNASVDLLVDFRPCPKNVAKATNRQALD